jgi:elongation factor G
MSDIIKTFRSVPDNLFRNIAISAHIDSGKTTLTERILFFTGRVHKIQEVHHGGATMDFMQQEKERGITIQSAAITCIWKNHRLNIIDTPGHVDFTIEVERSMRVLDGAIIVFDSVAGVEPQSETVWRQADKNNLPRMCFVNKMDRAGANFNKCLKEIRERLSQKAIVIAMPLGSESENKGLIDILTMKAYVWRKETQGRDFDEVEIPAEYMNEAIAFRKETIEAIASCDEDLLMRVLGGEELSLDDLKSALRKAVIKNQLIPVLCGSALKNIGVQFLLDCVNDYFPSPLECRPLQGNLYDKKTKTHERVPIKFGRTEPLCAFIFKTQSRKNLGNVAYIRIYSGNLKKGSTVYNPILSRDERISRIVLVDADSFHDVDEAYCGEVVAILFRERISKTGNTLCDHNYLITMDGIPIPNSVISMSVEAKDQKETLALIEALKEMCFDDPSLNFFVKDKQILLAGVGELHLEIVKERLETEHNIKVTLGQPKVAYQITPKQDLKKNYIHKKQSGGAGEFAEMELSIKPMPRGTGIIFKSEVVSGRVPTEYIPAIEAGIRESSNAGIDGCPIVDAEIILWDGSYHSVDSNSTIFKNTAYHSFIDLVKVSGITYLEPIMKVVVNLTGNANPFYGDVSGDIAKRRGIQCNESNSYQIVAEVPLSEMFGYINTLRSMTKGYGAYSMEFYQYKEMPNNLAETLIFKNK